jgi:hypothetical protein
LDFSWGSDGLNINQTKLIYIVSTDYHLENT